MKPQENEKAGPEAEKAKIPEGEKISPESSGPAWYFDASRLKTNEIPFSGDTVLAKIPQIPGRINRRNQPESNTTFIVLIPERHYDPETKQTTKKRVIIGTDAAPAFPGMMIPNETYYQYFDHDGNWIAGENDADPAITGSLKKQAAAKKQLAKLIEEANRNKAEKMAEEEQENREPSEQPQNRKQDLKTIVARRIKSEQHFDYLYRVFLDYNATVTQQVRKKPFLPMTLYQVIRINQILSELQILFAGTEMSPYLKLADIPENGDDEYIPPTYGDMDMILKPYYRAINVFLYK